MYRYELVIRSFSFLWTESKTWRLLVHRMSRMYKRDAFHPCIGTYHSHKRRNFCLMTICNLQYGVCTMLHMDTCIVEYMNWPRHCIQIRQHVGVVKEGKIITELQLTKHGMYHVAAWVRLSTPISVSRMPSTSSAKRVRYAPWPFGRLSTPSYVCMYHRNKKAASPPSVSLI